MDGDKVNVVIDGETMLFTDSGKTLDGGEMFRKFTGIVELARGRAGGGGGLHLHRLGS